MRLIILWTVLSVTLAASFASPVQKQIYKLSDDSSDSSESSELKYNEKTSYPLTKEDSSLDTSEEQPDINILNKEEADNESISSEEDKEQQNKEHYIVMADDDESTLADRSKRALDFTSHTNNQLADTDADKYKKYYKSRRPQRLAKRQPKPEEEQAKVKILRLRRNTDDTSDEDQSVQEENLNEVFIFSHERQEDYDNDHLKGNEYAVLDEKTILDETDKSLENKDSEEDYAKGCGGSNNHQDNDDSSSDNSNENNETQIDKF